MIFLPRILNHFYTRLKSGALQFVVFSGVLVSVLLFGAILLVYTQNLFDAKSDRLVSSLLKMEQAFFIPAETLNKAPLEDKSSASHPYETHSDWWGLFPLISTKDSITGLSKIGLAGGYFGSKAPAIYQPDLNQRLILVGNTHIDGDVSVSSQGLQRGNIGGVSFYSPQLLKGEILSSLKTLPDLHPQLLDHLKVLLKVDKYSFSAENIYTVGKQITHTFNSETRFLSHSEAIDLSGLKLTGNLVIYSPIRIIVGADTQLTDVILVAPEVTFFDRFVGSVQVFASKKITVGTHNLFKYPSVLAVVTASETAPVENLNTESEISLGAFTDFNGVILYLNETVEESFSANVLIAEGVAVKGQVYCNKNIELQGAISGSVYTNGFIVRKNGYVYKNHLLDARVDNRLDSLFSGLVFRENRLSPAKWLY